MSRYSRSRSEVSIILLIITVVTSWTYRAYIVYVLYGLVAIAALLMTLRLYRFIGLYHHPKPPTDIDLMDGIEFERYIVDLLIQNGFRNVSLTEKYDFGVDIVAEKGGLRCGIQVKRYNGLVKAAAVRQVVTALKHYNCDQAMVITNSTYSKVARQLADSNNCVLIDRMELIKLIG